MPSSRIANRERRSARGDCLLGVALVVLAVVAFWFASDIGRTGTGGGHDPGPRFFPLLLSCLLFACGAVQAAWGLFRPVIVPLADGEAESGSTLSESRPHRWFILLAVLTVYVVAIPWVGFSLSTLAMAAGIMVWLGNRWWVSVIVAVLMVIAVRLLFGILFRVQLPTGELGLPF
ncbi:MAG: tripartite tricarboxylate transporter TctB family protein [Pirellulaceae bacterium]|nr:tripartite tricarboxylate transporter TctB family protein [Pirellulaceae bacterium]